MPTQELAGKALLKNAATLLAGGKAGSRKQASLAAQLPQRVMSSLFIRVMVFV